MTDNDATPNASGWWSVLSVRPSEVEQMRRLVTASALVGFALVFFFSGSNALFLDQVGADVLPWVYLTNAPIVIAAGFGYAAWSRRTPTAQVLQASNWFLALAVSALWLWAALTTSDESAFALAVGFRFLFIFGFLGLWEIASALFDVRQSKRLVPAVAVGAMAAFMVGGALVGALTALIGAVHLIALSAGCFGLYAVAFARAMRDANFDAADASTPATPREIVADPFSRDLAFMRSIVILLIFVTEYIFYEQVAANFASDATIARFLGIFMAVATLVMVACTALGSSKYIARFGIGVGLASMPGGMVVIAVAMAAYGLVRGVDGGFFALAVFANLVNMVLANAVEMPVGAVMYQPMAVERRMPVRVAVDGWLGSVALILAGLLLLAFDAMNFSTVLPFVGLLAAIGIAGVVLARRLYGHYLDALAQATTVAFAGAGGSAQFLAGLSEGQGRHQAGLIGDDPIAAFALASRAQDIDERPLSHLLPELAESDDPLVATLVFDLLAADRGASVPAARVADIAATAAVDPTRHGGVRTGALRCLAAANPQRAAQVAAQMTSAPHQPLAIAATAIAIAHDPSGTVATDISLRSQSGNVEDRRFAARTIAAVDAQSPLDAELNSRLIDLLDDADDDVKIQAIAAVGGRVGPSTMSHLVEAGRPAPFRRRAAASLGTGGAPVVEYLDNIVSDLPTSYVVDLIDHVYGTNTRRPVVLHRFLEPTESSVIRRAGFDAVRRADVGLPATINRLLRDDVQFALLLVGAWRDIYGAGADRRGTQAFPLVDVVLHDEFEAARQAIWAGLKLAGEPRRIGQLEQLTNRSDDDTRANAIEVLDTLLSHETRRLVLPIIEPKDIAEAADSDVDLPDQQDAPATLLALRDHPRTHAPTRQFLAHYIGDDPALDTGPTKVETTTMSETIERVLALKSVDIFATLPYEILAELASVASRSEVAAGTTIIALGDFGDELFALTEGEVQVDRTDVSVALAAGTVFGELAVLDPGPRTATVTATTDCVLLVVDRTMLLALTDRRPEVMAEIARVLSARLRGQPSSA